MNAILNDLQNLALSALMQYRLMPTSIHGGDL